MANTHNLFLDFKDVITPNSSQLESMRESRKCLEKKVTAKFLEKGLPAPSYFTQGSSARDANTIIIKVDGTYDADRGVYLSEKPNVSAETIKSYIYDAVKDHTDGGAKNKQKCVRVLYKGNYDIDFTAYYEVKNESYSYLAMNGKGWIKDDPSKLIDWLKDKKDSNGQLVRIIKYMKAWASNLNNSFKMPSGIALTVWAANNFRAKNDRDDESLLLTLQAIKASIGSFVYCSCPVEPYDDLVAKRNDDQKKKFIKALELFCEDAQKAINETNQLKASELWIKHFGNRFPLGEDADVDKREKALMASASIVLSTNKKLDPHGRINEISGVSHQNHRNYGR